MLRTTTALLTALFIAVATFAVAAPAQAKVEDYARYQPQTKCSPKAKAGTKVLARFVVRRFGGSAGGISRPCRSGGTSEHKEGRAYDWSLNATRKADRKVAQAFMTWAFAADRNGNDDAKARKMGIMYVIWNDHIYSSWNGFAKSDYKSSSCKKLRKCSASLRHRNHIHISLSRKGGRGETSWYDGRVSG